MDFAIAFDDDLGAFDLVVEGDQFATTSTLDTAVALSLFLDARASDDDELDGDQRFGQIDRRGWWGGSDYGSLLWRFRRAKLTENTIAEIRQSLADSLQWLIDQAIARSVVVDVARQDGSRLDLLITITRNDSTPVEFSYVWDAMEGSLGG